MGFKSRHLIDDVRKARNAAGVSQRELSQQAGLTQSHISQIESGKMEPGLSSFIDMARALGLELLLVPKLLVPSVHTLVKAQTEPQTFAAMRRTSTWSDQAGRLIKKLKALYGGSADLDAIEEHVRFLGRVHLVAGENEHVQALIARLEGHEARPLPPSVIRDIRQQLQLLRNAIAHAAPVAPKPAYTLGDEDDDA